MNLIFLLLTFLQTPQRVEYGKASIIDCPAVRQQDSYSCFAACLFSVEAYWGVGEKDLDTLKRKLGTNKKNGTDYKRVVDHAKKCGLEVEVVKGMTIGHLELAHSQHRPVICSIQAYGNPVDYVNTANGHDVVVIGIDDRKVYAMDPSIDGRRGFIPRQEFEFRWHDDEGTPEHPDVIRHLGIVIWGKAPRAEAVRIE